MRRALKRVVASLPVDTVERALALSLLFHRYDNLSAICEHPRREELWIEIFEKQKGAPVTYLEFGVFEGYSIDYVARMYKDQDSRFYGFDSFIGLPENWFRTMERGTFDVGGRVPNIQDKRVQFVRGWFQNSLAPFLKEARITDNLIVHYDADLYSATLFVLMQLDTLKRPYHAIFDEFTGHETRALHNYQQATGAAVDFIGKVMNYGYPEQVSCLITPCELYEV